MKKYITPTNPLCSLSDSAGFTLLELSIVLVLVALVTTMAITSGIAVTATARQSSTVQKMAAIDKALMAFRTAHDRIPCPSDLTLKPGNSNYGVEAATPTLATNVTNQTGWDAGTTGKFWQTCTGSTPQANYYSLNSAGSAVASAEGGVPTVALGLPNDFMYDGWGNHIHYVVDVNMTTPQAFVATPAQALCGPINICDAGGVSSNACVNTVRSSTAIYALISHGANGYGGYSQNGILSAAVSSNPNERTNCHASGSTCPTLVSNIPQSITTPIYVQQAPGYYSTFINNQPYYYDDIVTFKERTQMQTAWDKQGMVCPGLWVVNSGQSDTGPNRVDKFDFNGNYLLSFPPIGIAIQSSKDGFLTVPFSVALDSKGNVWVADFFNSRIQELSPSGQWLMTIGGGAPTTGDSSNNCSGYATSTTTAAALPGTVGYCGQEQASCNCNYGSGNGLLHYPNLLAIDKRDNIWVVETVNNRIDEFSPAGQWLLTIGGGTACTTCTSKTACTCAYGTSAGLSNFGTSSFFGVGGIATDASGHIWETDVNRIMEFDNTGKWLSTIGGTAACNSCVSNTACTCNYGTANGQTSVPDSFAFDANGNIWVGDSGNNRIEEFTSTGTFIVSIGGTGGPPGTCTTSPSGTNPSCPAGSANGQFNGGPIALAIDPLGNLWAVDQANYRIQKFSNIAGVWTWQQSIPPSGATSSNAAGFLNTPIGIAAAR